MKIKIKKPNPIGVKIHGKNIYPELEDLEVTPSGEEQKFKSVAYGYNEVTVKAVPSEKLVIEPKAEEQNFTGLFSSVKVNKVTGEILEVNPTLEKQYFKGIYTDITINEIIGEDLEIIPSLEEQVKSGIFTNVKVNPIETEDIEINPSFEEQNFSGIFQNIKANPIQAEEIILNPTNELQTEEGLFNKVTINPIESEELNVTPQKTPQEFNGLFNKVNVEAVEINLQDKIIEPTKSVQEVMADDNFDGMKKVTISAIPDEFIIPTDNIAITENGTYNVKDYETATVQVPIPEPNLGTKEVTANGEYSASEDNLDGYSKVSVNIPVPEPNVASKTITENGTYNANDEGLDGYSSVEVNVASGGGNAEPLVEKDVNFYTPYGELVASYTIAEANTLNELPQAPELPRLTFQEWNYDLEDIQSTKTPLDIGGTYTTTSGATEFDVDVNSQSGMTINFYNPIGITSIDWGDGTVDNTLTHTYTTAGKYTILIYGITSFGLDIMNGGSTGTNVFNYNLKEVRIADGMTLMSGYAFQCCQALKYITIPSSLISYNSSAEFRYAYSLEFCVFAKGTSSIPASYMFANCYALKGVSMPLALTRFATYLFQKCYALNRVIFSKNATTLQSYMFSDCFGLEKLVLGNITTFSSIFSNNYALKEIDLTSCTSVPTLSGTYLNNINKTCKIKVPANLYENFKTASNWSTYKDYFVAI